MGLKSEQIAAKRRLIDTTPGLLDVLKAKARGRIVRGSVLGCWLAPGSTNSGYPVLYLPRRWGGVIQVNHLAWRLARGTWHTMLLLHKCDDKLCVRPDHHYDGDEHDNALDHLGRPWAQRCHGEKQLTLPVAVVA
jgi:hypothetical protein